ncbi:unnamed protein product, partial [Polarella glacialis]
MAQRPTPSSGLAIGAAAAGGLMILGSSSQAFVSAPAVAASGHNLRASSALAAQSQPAASAAGASVAPVVACTGFAAAALAGQRASRRQNRSSALSTVVPVQSAVQRRALDQSSRYADLSLDEEQLIKNGKHLLVAYIMKPKAGYDYLATAAHFAAESSTGTNVNVCTTDDFTKSVDALVYYIDPDNEEMKIAYPTLLFDRNITDGRAMMCSVLTLSIGNNQGMGDVEYGKIYDIYFPPAYLRLFDGPNCNVVDMWRILNRGMSNGGLIVGTIIKPKLGLQPKPFGEACYAFWQGGDFIKNDEPQGNQVFCQMNECIPEVVKAMRAAIKETGSSKLFSANITADDPNEMIARGKYVLSQFGYYIDPDNEEMKIAYPTLLFADDPNEMIARVGYLPDGTPLNMAGNNVNHPERNGSPLPPPLKGYVNDIGYTPDGTPMDKAGNLSVKKCAAAAGGLMILGSSSQAFVSAPAVAASGHNLRASSALAAQSQPAASAAGASVAPVVACTGFAAAALAGQRASRRQNRSSALPTVVPVQSAVQRRALDQSSRYADLSLDEEQLIKNGKHLLVAYIMKPKAGYDYLATAAHFAAESSTGTNVNVCTTDDFTKSVDALVYYIDPDN